VARQTLPGTGPTRSPGLITRRNGGVFVVDAARPAARGRLLARPADAVAGLSLPSRGGFTP
jgi:hypothetical protein